MIPAMTTGMMDFMMSSGLITDMAAIPVPLFAVPYAAPNAAKEKKKVMSYSCNINGTCFHSTVLYVWQLNICLTFITGSTHRHPHRCWCCVKRKTALSTVIYKGLFVSLTITPKYSHSDAFWIKSALHVSHNMRRWWGDYPRCKVRIKNDTSLQEW